MAKNKKDVTYNRFQSYVKDKDLAVRSYIDRHLAMTSQMFAYDGLPDTIPAMELERILQTDGDCIIAEAGGGLYALAGSAGGKQDAYYQPTEYVVANPWLNISKTYTIGDDCVRVKNDHNADGLLPILGKFAVMHTDAIISLNTASILTRLAIIISASDDKTKQSADEYVRKILNGDFSIIGTNAFFEGVKVQTGGQGNANGNMLQLVEVLQYIEAKQLNALGLNANFNMKRERLNMGEIDMNNDILLPFVDGMLHERTTAMEQVNKMFGTSISVSLNSAWKLEHEKYAAEHTPDEPSDAEEEEEVTPDEPQDADAPDEPQDTDTPDEQQDDEEQDNDKEKE